MKTTTFTLALIAALVPLPAPAEGVVQEEWNAQKRAALIERSKRNQEVLKERMLETERLFREIETRGLATPEMQDLWRQAQELTRDALR